MLHYMAISGVSLLWYSKNFYAALECMESSKFSEGIFSKEVKLAVREEARKTPHLFDETEAQNLTRERL